MAAFFATDLELDLAWAPDWVRLWADRDGFLGADPRRATLPRAFFTFLPLIRLTGTVIDHERITDSRNLATLGRNPIIRPLSRRFEDSE